MINRIYKIINSKFSRFFKFVFFIRYLIVIFFVSVVLFLIIPCFFDYKKKEEIIKLNLIESYSLEIQKIDHINYKFFPSPHLILGNVNGNLYSDETNLKTQRLILYPKLFSIYNYKNFDLRKIKFKNSKLELDSRKSNLFTKNLINLRRKFYFKDLNLLITNKKDQVINFKKINISNYGYKKNKIQGEVFNRKFKIKLKDDLSNINFKLLNTGISANLNLFDKQQSNGFIGEIRGKILKSNFKFNFIYDLKKFEINNFFFRGKNLSLDSDGSLNLKPYFAVNLKSKIKDVNPKIFLDINIEQLLNYKDFIKRLNIKNEIIYNSKKFNRNLVDEVYLSSDLSFGRLNIIKRFSVAQSNIYCKSEINLLDTFPVLYYKCNIDSSSKKELLKKVGINYKNKNESLDLNFIGNLNILNNKVNFDSITMNNNYNAPEEDLNYFKDMFENIVLDKKFRDIFELQKIRSFIEEII